MKAGGTLAGNKFYETTLNEGSTFADDKFNKTNSTEEWWHFASQNFIIQEQETTPSILYI